MKRSRAVVWGELVWDLHAPGAIAEARSYVRQPGGAAAIVALALARAGVATAIGGTVGDDVLGTALLRELGRGRIDTSAVARAGRTGLVLVAGTNDADPQCIGYAAPASTPAAAPRGWTGALLHVASLPPDRASCAALEPLAARAALVSVDLNARPRLWPERRLPRHVSPLLATAAFVKASAGDLLAVGHEARWSRLRALRQALAPDGVLLVTRGARSSWLAGPWGERRVPVVPVRTRRTTVGAGDRLVAEILVALLAEERERDETFWKTTLARAHGIATRFLRNDARGGR